MTGSAKDEIAWYARGLEDGARNKRDPMVPSKWIRLYLEGFHEGEMLEILKGEDGFVKAVEHIHKRREDGYIDGVLAMDLVGIAIEHRNKNTFTITKDLLDRLLEKQRHYDALELAVTSGNIVDDLRMLKKLVTNCKVKDVVANLAEELYRRRNPGWLQQVQGQMASSGGRGKLWQS